MICSWSLLHDVLKGTLDEEYPIMNNFNSAEEGGEWVKENGGYEYTSNPDDPRNYVYESPDGGETVYKRANGSNERILVKSPHDDPNQLNLFEDKLFV